MVQNRKTLISGNYRIVEKAKIGCISHETKTRKSNIDTLHDKLWLEKINMVSVNKCHVFCLITKFFLAVLRLTVIATETILRGKQLYKFIEATESICISRKRITDSQRIGLRKLFYY